MEICQERPYHTEFIARIDEDVGLAAPGPYSVIFGLTRRILQGTHRRRSDRDHTSSCVHSSVELFGAGSGNFVWLTVQSMIFDPMLAHRLEGSQPNMQRYLGRLNPTVSYAGKNLWREVQSRGWRRDRTALAGVDGLIAIPIGGAFGPVDIRWRSE